MFFGMLANRLLDSTTRNGRACARLLSCRFLLLALAGAIVIAGGPAAWAQKNSGRLIAIVNDQAISEYDVKQRMNLNVTLNNEKGPEKLRRKRALDQLIENILKKQEAQRLKLAATKDEVDKNYASMADRAGVTQDAWEKRLKQGGVAVETIKKEIEASLSWRRVVRLRFGRQIQVETADVDREYNKVLQAPRESQTFYVLRRIVLPVKQGSSAAAVRLRMADAVRIVQNFKGCGRIRQAVQGIFNVKILGAQNVPSQAVPAPLRAALNKAGPGRAVGPGNSAEGVVVIAYCNRKKVDPPEISREQVETQLLYRKFDRIGAQFLADLKRDAIIEYKADDLRS